LTALREVATLVQGAEGVEIDVFLAFRIGSRTFECFHGHVYAEESDGLEELQAKVHICIDRELFPADIRIPAAAPGRLPSRVRAAATRYTLAFVAVCAMTFLIGLMQLSAPRNMPVLLYMVAVLGIAMVFGRGPSLFASVAAFVQHLAWEQELPVPPISTLTAAPEDWVRLGILALAALAVSGHGTHSSSSNAQRGDV
jgi:K+-sensing histidine kinase KdpD